MIAYKYKSLRLIQIRLLIIIDYDVKIDQDQISALIKISHTHNSHIQYCKSSTLNPH